jgi:MoxR-like ATPase
VELKKRIQRFQAVRDSILGQVRQVIVGQEEVLDQILISLFVGGHCLITGLPGTAKTLMVRTIAQTLGLAFKRIQFTPDLMPSDITGTDIIEEDPTTGHRRWTFVPGPIFANVVLADEINRTPPKTQAALLEAMQEHQVTAGGKRHKLPDAFFVLATQNPIEQEGTYPLPEAQLDRFMFEILVDYPSEDEEFELVRKTTSDLATQVEKILSAEEVARLQHVVRRMPVADHVIRYAMQLARLTRRQNADIPDFVRNYVSWGAGPRASQYLILGAKARAMLKGRAFVNTEDVREVAAPVLRHRIITNFNAEADGVSPDTIVSRLTELVPADSSKATRVGRLPEVFRSADAGEARRA